MYLAQTGGSLKFVPHQLGVSSTKIVSASPFCFAKSKQLGRFGAGRAWGWLGATSGNQHAFIVLQTPLPLLLDLSSGRPLHAAGDYSLHIGVAQGLAIVTERIVDRATLAVFQGKDQGLGLLAPIGVGLN